MNDSIPTDMLVNAQIRIATAQGVSMMVRRRGDNHSGTLILKINKLDGMARILTQVRFGDELAWSLISDTDPMPDADAEAYLEQQSSFDPDSWQIEIEDRTGKHWFPGRILKITDSI